MKKEKITCKYCGSVVDKYDKKGRPRSFCSASCVAKFMGEKNRGRKITNEHKQKIVLSRRDKNGVVLCRYCGKKIQKYHKKQDVCSRYSCRMKHLEETNPILAKVRRITSNIRLKNKTEIVSKMIDEALGKPCEYCGEIITLKNLSIDHKIPIKHRKVARGEYSKEELEELNRPENLHIICKKCNNIKSDLTDEEFRALLSFLENRGDLKKKIINRLKRSQNVFKIGN